MKINIDKSLVEFAPENESEKQSLDALWKLMIDCVKFNKKLVPVGAYLPSESTVARFNIED